jgi:hypothetical protein
MASLHGARHREGIYMIWSAGSKDDIYSRIRTSIQMVMAHVSYQPNSLSNRHAFLNIMVKRLHGLM